MEEPIGPVSIIQKITYRLSEAQIERTNALMEASGLDYRYDPVPKEISTEVFAMGGQEFVSREVYSKDGIHSK